MGGASMILGSAIILGGLGLTFGTLIAIVHRKMWVWEDPRIDTVAGMLPGSNCGACGFPGCRGLAEALVAGKATPASCTVMNAYGREEVAAYLGIEVGEVTQRVARLLCAGGTDAAPQRAEYRGLATCKAAAVIAGGGKSCGWGCLGLGDCAVACKFDAIFMSSTRLPLVIPERCVACGDCVEVCPKDLFVLMPIEHKLIVQCKSQLAGDEIQSKCKVACTACGKCAQDAPPGLISIINGLAVVDYSKNDLAGPEVTNRCPTGAIAWVEGAQFRGRIDPAERLVA